MNTPQAGKIFISYTHADSASARRIADALKRAGLEPWIDQEEIGPGDSFLEKMNAGLAASAYVLLLMSAAALASRWVNREWMSTLARQGTVLLPLLLEKCPLPPLLTDIVYIDFSNDFETGLRQLMEFFQRESRPATAPVEGRRGPLAAANLRGCSRRELRLVAQHCLDEPAFQAFLFDAEIEPGRIVGNSLHEKLVALLHITVTEGVLEHFADWLSRERPRCVTQQLEQVRREPSWTL